MANNQHIQLVGVKELQRSMDRLAPELMNAAESAVLRAGARPILQAAKANVAVGKEGGGLLKRSLGMNVKKVRGVTDARIGPRKGWRTSKGMVTARKDGKNRTKGEQYEAFADPRRYSHFVEFGSSRLPARPFMRPAIDSSAPKVVDAMAQGLSKYLDRVAARLARRAAK